MADEKGRSPENKKFATSGILEFAGISFTSLSLV